MVLIPGICLDFFIGSFGLGSSSVQLIQVQVDLYGVIRLLLGQKNNRLHVGAAGEHVHGAGRLQAVAVGAEARHVAGQGGRVAGDVDDAVRRHLRHGVHHLRRQTLPRRIHHDHLRADAVGGKPGGGLTGVGTEEARVRNAVAGRIFPGVVHGGGHGLHAVDQPGLPGQEQRDGAGAAVEIQGRRLRAQLRQLQGDGVENLCLVPVDLEEGAGRQPEAQAAERFLQVRQAPEAVERLAQHGVAPAGIDVP